MAERVAILVDGDNVSHTHADRIRQVGKRHGYPGVVRVYGNAAQISRWSDVPGYRLIHSGTGKNATDLLLTVDAMELALSGEFAALIIATSDGDFSHLSLRLRELGHTVIGVGEEKAPLHFRAACAAFELLGAASPRANEGTTNPKELPPSELDRRIRGVIAANSKNGEGMLISHLGPRMHSGFGTRISTYPERTWRAYLLARKSLYDLDPRGPDAKVRFKPKGFSDAT